MYIQSNEQGIKVVPASKSWRLIHNNGKVISLAESEFKSETGGSTEVFVATTKEECDAEVNRLGLKLPKERPIRQTHNV